MDNASKALIMAGAILIAVALVSLGVYLYQSAASKVEGGTRQVDAAQMLMLNSEIEKYCGTNIKGSELTQLSRLMTANNKNQVFPTDLFLMSGDTDNPTIPSGTKSVGKSFRSSGNYIVAPVYSTDGWIAGAIYKQTTP